MHSHTIPADTPNGETQPAETSINVNGPSLDHETSATEAEQAASQFTFALHRQLAAEEERCARLAANFENFKKRTAQELDQRAAAQKDSLVNDLLPVMDNFERAVASAASASKEQLCEGIQIIWQQLVHVMREHGFETREDIGRPFDPKFHDAVGVRADAKHADNAILEVWRRGWLQGNNLFRPAKVVVNELNGGQSD